MESSLHEAQRVAGYADEYAANYFAIYDGELEDDDHSADPMGVQAGCDEISAAGRQDYPHEAFRWPNTTPPNLNGLARISQPPPSVIGPLGRPELRLTRKYGALPEGKYTTEFWSGPIWRGYHNRAAMRRRPYEW